TFSASPLWFVNTGPCMSKNSVRGSVTTSKKTGTFAIPFPLASITRAKTCVELETVMRGGSARRQQTALTRALPTGTLRVAEPVPPDPPVLGIVVEVVVEGGVVVAMVEAEPPETAWIC